LSSTKIGEEVTELTGVKLETEYCVGSDEETKAGVMIASGDYPDLINARNVSGKFIEAGAFIPLEDYIENKGENIKKAYEGNLKKLIQDDGHTYFLSPSRAQGDMLYSSTGFWLPAGVLEEFDYPEVKTFEQYIDIFVTTTFNMGLF
jgi:ABC-type glycerol-3-phosphate transport system substrate-binding protein